MASAVPQQAGRADEQGEMPPAGCRPGPRQMKFLLTGRTGQVGWELQRCLAPLGRVIALDRSQLDIGNAAAISACIRETRPDVVVNAAAFTAVDRAETEPQLAQRVNAVGPGTLAEEAKRCGALLVHYSTDYVFDGRKPGPYLETDATGPLGVYGASKLAGEQAIVQAASEFLVLRTSWVYGARGANFMRTILRLALTRDRLRIVNDQYGAPTWSRLIAEATGQILAQRAAARAWESGIYHLACAGSTSWHGFARAILDEAAEEITRLPLLEPITTEEYPLPAKRPANSLLDCSKLQHTFGIALPDWRAALALCMRDGLQASLLQRPAG